MTAPGKALLYTLRDRSLEIHDEYVQARKTKSESVAVAQLILALARTERERDEARRAARLKL